MQNTRSGGTRILLPTVAPAAGPRSMNDLHVTLPLAVAGVLDVVPDGVTEQEAAEAMLDPVPATVAPTHDSPRSAAKSASVRR